jgi:hypothetical protein
MYYKRPSFKRGGSTGIAQLTPSRQGYAGGGNIGGGGIGGRNLGTRTGFNIILNEFGLPYEKPPSTYKPNFNLRGGSYVPKSNLPMVIPEKKIPTGGLTRGSRGARLISQLRGLSVPSLSTTGIMATPFVLPAGLAYMNKPETLAEKKVMQEYGPIDETEFMYDKYYADREEASKVGDKISFSDALFMDPETGQYPKMFGRTEDRNKQADKSGIGQLTFTKNDDIRQNYQFNQANEIVERAKEDKTTIELGGDDSSITLDPLKEIEREKNFLNNLLANKGLERGEAALVAAKAIGTAGSFKDKLDAAVDMALPIVRKRNEQDKAVTLTAYKAFKEKEATQARAQADADKPTNELKNINLMAQAIKNQGDKRNLSVIRDELVVEQSGMNSDIKKLLLDTAPNIFGLVEDIDNQRKLLAIENSKKKPKEKNIEKIKENIRGKEDSLKMFRSWNKNAFDRLFGTLTKGYFAEGGRVKRQLGSPETGEQIVKTEDTVVSMPGGSVPEKPVLNLSYDELRNRLPKSITDDIIQLLANSEEALQEFAYITSQDDVNSFNVKYGVNLIIPPTTG